MPIMSWTKITFFICLIAFALPMLISAQDSSQTMSVTPPSPSRRIERPPADANPADLEERGDQLRGEKAYLDALDYYQAAVKKLNKGPSMAMVLNKMGITQFQMQRYEDSKKSYEKAIKNDKNYANAYNNLGVVYYRNKRFGRAIKFYRKAIGLDVDNASFHNNVAAAYFADKQFEKAMPEYQKALELDPDIFERRSTNGIVAQIAPQDQAHYYYVLAKMYAQVGKFDRALLYLRRAIEDGYKDVNNALQDVEFAQLRKDPRFNDLMSLQRPPSIQ